MPAMTVRNIPDDVHKALRMLAARNGRSTEAQVREILAEAVRSEGAPGFGSAMHARFAGIEGNELDRTRNRTPPEPDAFE